MIALYCYPEHRQRSEQELLKSYFEELAKEQIEYSWDELLIDYRVYAAVNVLRPIGQYSHGGFVPMIWWNHLERSFAAFEDLGCMELLSSWQSV
jgi:hypothetical protein|tara:strand:- start:345 stop:626 length:282 start_codon:yes stop_codon:yes gene_type:complete